MIPAIRILVVMILCFNPIFAQYDTGSDDLNSTLVSIDAHAKSDFTLFKADVSTSYNISKAKIDYLSIEIGMSAGDIYLTVEIAKITRKSVDEVVRVYKTHRGKGWGVIAKELGIKPGSAEFHALKNNGSKGHGNKHKQHKGKGKG